MLPTSMVRSNEVEKGQRVAILIPCLNEERTVAAVIAEFQQQLPNASIWVIDNGSTDDTSRVAAAAGAKVLREPRMGKDLPSEPPSVISMRTSTSWPTATTSSRPRRCTTLSVLWSMVAPTAVGSRVLAGKTSHSPINDFGNVLFLRLLRLLLGVRITDVLSGYPAMSRLLVKGLPLTSRNFEIEVELTIKTTERKPPDHRGPVRGPPAPLDPPRTYGCSGTDFELGWAIIVLFRNYRPMAFFGVLATAFLLLATLVYASTGGLGTVWFVPADALALLLAVAGLLWLAVGALASVLGRRLQELEGKVDMVTTNGLLAVTEPPPEEPQGQGHGPADDDPRR